MPLSIILPALNEMDNLPLALSSLRGQGPCEIIVVDAGSTDATLEAARQADLVLSSPPGRAAQMNLGAAHATGDLLLFLHADCRLEAGALDAIHSTMGNNSISAACFTMRVQAEGIAYRCIDWCAAARVRLTGIIYGDQGLAVRRDRFTEIGGFPGTAFLEDVLISRKLRRLGRVVVLPQRIFVSPRRWQRQGLVRQTLRNWILTGLALGGVSVDWLGRFYPAHDGFRPNPVRPEREN